MRIIRKFENYMINLIIKIRYKIIIPIKTIYIFKQRKGQAAILIGSPEHGNIGDHAISLAEIKFLKDYYPNLQVIEISGEHFRKDTKSIIKRIDQNDIVLITGGGFLGDLWITEEQMVRTIIDSLPVNPIIIFPQTIYFNNSACGRNEKNISKICYESHKNLCICLREKKSYKFIENEFPNITKKLLVPDIVTYLNFTEPLLERKGVLLCMRKDKEQVLPHQQLRKIESLMNKYSLHFTYTSTVVDHGLKLSERQNEFIKKINEFKCSRVVITDRLHGMLFAAVSGTPCIALNNLSGKVEGVYEWIKYLDYIKYAADWSDIEKFLKKLLNNNVCAYDNKKLKPYFNMIVQEINKYVK